MYTQHRAFIDNHQLLVYPLELYSQRIVATSGCLYVLHFMCILIPMNCVAVPRPRYMY
jgi:hypothetical protein